MTARTKQRWGSQPGKERGAKPSRSEGAYLRKVDRARLAGAAAARNPRATEEICPPGYSEEERSYWTAEFRRQRRRG